MAGRNLTRGERIEREAEALYRLNAFGCTRNGEHWESDGERVRAAYRKLATRVIDQRDAREWPLVANLARAKRVLQQYSEDARSLGIGGKDGIIEELVKALAAHAALDAAPERTLAEVAVDVLNDYHSDSKSSVRELRVVLLDELRAALEREKGGR